MGYGMADLDESNNRSLIYSDLDPRVRTRKVCRLPEQTGGNGGG